MGLRSHSYYIYVGVKEAQMLGTSNVQTYRETEHMYRAHVHAHVHKHTQVSEQ